MNTRLLFVFFITILLVACGNNINNHLYNDTVKLLTIYQNMLSKHETTDNETDQIKYYINQYVPNQQQDNLNLNKKDKDIIDITMRLYESIEYNPIFKEYEKSTETDEYLGELNKLLNTNLEF